MCLICKCARAWLIKRLASERSLILVWQNVNRTLHTFTHMALQQWLLFIQLFLTHREYRSGPNLESQPTKPETGELQHRVTYYWVLLHRFKSLETKMKDKSIHLVQSTNDFYLFIYFSVTQSVFALVAVASIVLMDVYVTWLHKS